MSTENTVAVVDQTNISTHVETLTQKQLTSLTTKINNELNNINNAFVNITNRSLRVASLFAKVNAHASELPNLGYANMEEYALKEFNMQYSTMRAYVSIGESGLVDDNGKCLIGDFTFDQLRAINSLHDEKAVKALIDGNMLTSDMTSKDVKSVIKKAKDAKKIMTDDDNIIDVINTSTEKNNKKSDNEYNLTRAEQIDQLRNEIVSLITKFGECIEGEVTKDEAIVVVDNVEKQTELVYNLRLLGKLFTDCSNHIAHDILGKSLMNELREKFPLSQGLKSVVDCH